MRIAISGTHCCGKSTLIDDFLLCHRGYVHEPEPYEALQEIYGEVFAAEPTADDLYRQLEYQVDRLHQYGVGDRVIFERSPVDYLAYLLALGDLDRDTADARLAERALEMAQGSIALLDAIVFLPAGDDDGVVADAEDPELRRAVNARLEELFFDDDSGLFTDERPAVVEAWGTTAERLRIVEGVLR